MDLKQVKAPVTTKTYDRNIIEKPTENIYEAISVISRRAEQINTEIRKELLDKLEEFATFNDSLEEIFENKEQIEVSKFYEKLPKPHALAVQEWLNGNIYFRNTEEEEEEEEEDTIFEFNPLPNPEPIWVLPTWQLPDNYQATPGNGNLRSL